MSLLFACGGSDKANSMAEEGAVEIKVPTADLAMIKDPICQMPMKNVPITDTVQINGKVYPFCAKKCKEIFNKDRSKYVVN